MTRLEHRRFHKKVDAWVDAEVDEAGASFMGSHLRECWDCSSAAEMTKLIKGSLGRLPEREPSPLAAARMHRYAQRLVRA